MEQQNNQQYNQNQQYNPEMDAYDPQYQQNIQQSNKSTRTALIVAAIIFIISLSCCCGIPSILGFTIFSVNKEEIQETIENVSDDLVGDSTQSVHEHDDYDAKDNNYTDYSYQDLSGVTWISDVDGYWEFTDNDTCYLNSDDGSYFEADYIVLYDDDAIKYINDELPQYGVTTEEQERVLSGNNDFEHYICVVFDNVSYYQDGELSESTAYNIIPYFGFMYDDDDCYKYELAGMNSANYSYFTQYK